MNQNSNHKFSDGERNLFKSIADYVQANPNDYKEDGEWLDEYCSESAYWLRQEDKLGKLKKEYKRFPVLTYQKQVDHLENKIKERRTPALIIRFQEARNYLLDNYRDKEFVSKEIAAKVVIITWLLTDPDAEKKKVGITKLETWPWKPIDDISKMTRGYAELLFSKTEERCKSWLRLLRICFQIKERKANREKWYQNRTIQAALIGAGVLLLVSIVGWYRSYNSGETTNIFAYVSKDGTILRSKNFPWKITKTKYRNGNILYTIVDRRGDPTAISVFPDNSINEYFVRDSWDGLVIEFTCAEEKISDFTIKVKY
jgi:hypothetical protein